MRSGGKRCEVAGTTCGVAEKDAKSRGHHAKWMEKMRSGGKRCEVGSTTCEVAKNDAKSLGGL